MSNFPEKTPFWIEFLAGWVGGVGQVLSAQPFDIIKIRLQTQDSAKPKYKNMVDCFKKIMAEEGPMTFYKGTASPLVGVGSICATQFMAYQECRKFLTVSFF
jgi:solute carrier family 25 carnitine/acylcarnitine transporter 20/29